MKTNVNFSNNKKALEYTIYMMVGSYFAKAKCNNEIAESKFRLMHHEMKLEKQYEMEECCEKYIEEIMLKNLPEEIWQQEVKVRFATDKVKKRRAVTFYGKGFVLTVTGKYKKGQYQFWYWL